MNERITGILNAGRCSRCLASKNVFDEMRGGTAKRFYWCVKYERMCRDVAGFQCKEPPMGMSAREFAKLVSARRRGN